MPTVVRNSVPADLSSSALTSQTRMIADAGDDLFSWRFATHYGLNADLNPLWAQFLDGRLSAEALAEHGIEVARVLVGDYITSLDMAGCSLTLVKADDELLRLWDAPVNTTALRWGV